MSAVIINGAFVLTKEQYLNHKFPEEMTPGDDVRVVLDNGHYWEINPYGDCEFYKPDGTNILSVYADTVSDPVFEETYIDPGTDWMTPLEERYFANQPMYEEAFKRIRKNIEQLEARAS